MKLPYFAFYPSDFFMKTMNLSDEQVGRYVRLLCNEWFNGPLKEVSDDLRVYFKESPDGYINERLEKERVKAVQRHDQTSKAAAMRWDKRTHIREDVRTVMQPEPEPEPELKSKAINKIVAPKVAISLEDRILKFKKEVSQYLNEYNPDMLKEFFDYWTEYNEGGKLFRAEMKKSQPFNIKRRLATWAKRSQGEEIKKSGRKFPAFYDANFVRMQCQDPKIYQDYQKHLRELGWKEQTGPGGSSWIKQK